MSEKWLPKVGDKVWVAPLVDPDGTVVGYAFQKREGYREADLETLQPVDITDTDENNKIMKFTKRAI